MQKCFTNISTFQNILHLFLFFKEDKKLFWLRPGFAPPPLFTDRSVLLIVFFYAFPNLSGLLVVVWNNASDEVGLRGVEGVHQGVELLGVEGGDGLGAAALLLLPLRVTVFLAALG